MKNFLKKPIRPIYVIGIILIFSISILILLLYLNPWMSDEIKFLFSTWFILFLVLPILVITTLYLILIKKTNNKEKYSEKFGKFGFLIGFSLYWGFIIIDGFLATIYNIQFPIIRIILQFPLSTELSWSSSFINSLIWGIIGILISYIIGKIRSKKGNNE